MHVSGPPSSLSPSPPFPSFTSVQSSLLSLHSRSVRSVGAAEGIEWRAHVQRRPSRGLRHLSCVAVSHPLDSIMHMYPNMVNVPRPLSASPSASSLPPSRDLRRGSIGSSGRRGSSIGQGGFPQLGRPMCEREFGQYRKSIFVVAGCQTRPIRCRTSKSGGKEVEEGDGYCSMSREMLPSNRLRPSLVYRANQFRQKLVHKSR